MAEGTLVEAVTLALRYEMARDDCVVILGEDVGVNGGVFRATEGLQKQFGSNRVLDTPLAEGLIAGISIGMAAQGLKPVAEIQFMGFIFPALEQIACHAARLRNRTRGRLSCPLVIRAPFGGGIRAPEHHSESTEALLAHLPGLRVVVPSSAYKAYGLLLAAIRDPDPVIFLEPKRIYRAQRQRIPNDGQALPLDTCFTLREGTDLTLVSWGAMISECTQVANDLATRGISIELIDVATIKPLDMETIVTSVKKTGRCVIVHEAPRAGGVGADIAAQVNEQAFLELQAPVARVTGFDTIMPYARKEDIYMPNTIDIQSQIEKTLNFS
ncbi:MAG TPA: alpha-ketoacid dehydrogenase subunit beta [Porticoccaceae bacterium]|nr:alpha-ketoacid dehydrogenase subunit beta [Porticoccaceae bacterium]